MILKDREKHVQQQNRFSETNRLFILANSRMAMQCMRILRTALLGIFCIALFCACGKKSEPIVPRAIGPEAVKKLRAVARSGGITFLWRAPTKNTDDTPLLDLEGFKIYREEVRFEDRCQKCPKNFRLLFEYAYKGPRGKVPERELLYYTDRSVKPGHVYSYKIDCLNMRDMLGASSDTVTVYWDVPPSPPEAVTLKRNGRFIVLAWDSPATLENGAPFAESKSFDIYRSARQGVFEEAPLNTEPITATAFEDKPDTYDQTYFYTVRAVRKVFDTFIESAPSAEVSLLYEDITPPGAPQGLTAIPAKDGVILKWIAKAEPGIAGFYVYRKDPAGKECVRISREIIPENSWIDRTARIGQRYTYAVKTVDQSLRKNDSAFSEPVTVLHLP
jgi:hypothetical protein